MTPDYSHPDMRLRFCAVLLSAFVLLNAVLPAAVVAQPQPSAPPTETPAPTPGFEITASQPKASLPEGGTMRIVATATVPAGTDYLEVRLRVFRPDGGLLHQKTEVRHETSPTVRFSFERPLDELEMDAGKYPFELQMRATGTEPVRLNGSVLVYSPDAPPVRFTLVTRFACTPALDPQGRFALDPGIYTRTREELLALDSLLARSPRIKVSAAIPPLLLEDWSRAASGYRLAGPEGLREIPAENPTARRYADALATARRLASSRQVDLLQVPYAEPDVVALQRIGGLKDLALHYSEGFSTYARSLGATPSPVTTLLAARLPAQTQGVLDDAGIEGAVLDVGSLRTPEGTATPGLYRISRDLKVLAWDREVTQALKTGDETRLVTALYDRSAEVSVPVVAVLDLGTGAPMDLASVAPMLQRLAKLPWVRFSTASQELRSGETSPASLRKRFRDRKPAPGGYWNEVAKARRLMRALQAAGGAADRDASAVRADVLLAESRCWAGPDQSWSLVDRGRTFSASAVRRAEGVFGKLTLERQDLTLSGARGLIPVSIRNGTGRELRVRLVVSARYARFPKGRERVLRLRKAENYLTLPIDLGSSLSDSVRVSLVAGDEVVADETIRVRGSFLDKIALVGLVSVALLGMLWFIRKRVRAAEADAGNMKETRER